MKHKLLIGLGLALLLLVGCGSPAAIPIPELPTATPPPATSTLPPPTPTEEIYEELDSSELDIELIGALQSLQVDSGGNLLYVEGKVTKMTVGKTAIELTSTEIVMEGTEAFVVTKDYGKIRLTFTSRGAVIIWLKPSQKAKLQELAP